MRPGGKAVKFLMTTIDKDLAADAQLKNGAAANDNEQLQVQAHAIPDVAPEQYEPFANASLDQIEKRKLAPLGDPRVHMVLNCASLGCPPLSPKAFTGDNIAHHLAASTRAWLPNGGAIINQQTQEIVLSEIFKWYADEFPNTTGPAIKGIATPMQGQLKFIAEHLPEDQARFILSGGYSYRHEPFNWTVNSR